MTTKRTNYRGKRHRSCMVQNTSSITLSTRTLFLSVSCYARELLPPQCSFWHSHGWISNPRNTAKEDVVKPPPRPTTSTIEIWWEWQDQRGGWLVSYSLRWNKWVGTDEFPKSWSYYNNWRWWWRFPGHNSKIVNSSTHSETRGGQNHHRRSLLRFAIVLRQEGCFLHYTSW